MSVSKHQVYFKMTKDLAELSKCERKKVGCLVVKDTHILSEGVNGTIAGHCNQCEDQDGHTKSEVLHAEQNAIIKAAKHGIAIEGADMYLTLTPCTTCAIMIAQAGIKTVYYGEVYRNRDGIEFLKQKTNVEVQYIKEG